VNANRWLVVALAILTVVTLAQSVQVERSTAYGLTRITNRASGHALVDLADDGSTQMRERFAAYLALRPYAEGATIVAPTAPRVLATTAVRGLTGAELVYAPFDPSIDGEVARLLRQEARVEGVLEVTAGTIEVVGPAQPAPVHVVLVDDEGTAYVTSADQLSRHGIEPPGLDLDALLDGTTDDG
jgi:hypothetical protein